MENSENDADDLDSEVEPAVVEKEVYKDVLVKKEIPQVKILFGYQNPKDGSSINKGEVSIEIYILKISRIEYFCRHCSCLRHYHHYY